jgi:DNA-binding SARP family transcriptional activator/streptogramin lyase
LRFAILGPFVVLDHEQPVAVGRGAERALLALLALHANEPLSADRIVTALWGDDPPASAREMVRLYVSRARSRIGDRLATEGGGYVLRVVDDDAVDLRQFEQFRRAGNEALSLGDAEVALAELERAVALWRGDPLAELADVPFAHAEIPRLEELRLAATEEYNDASFACGRGAELVPTLERLVDKHPYRERLRGQLMLALYRAGRQTEALDRYREGRRLLAEEIGVEPGPELRELERAILQHDPVLVPSRAEAAVEEPAPSQAPRRRRHHRWLLAAAAAVAFAAIGGIGGLLVTRASGRHLTVLPTNSLGLVDTDSGTLEAAVKLPGVPVDLAGSAQRLWVALGEPHQIAEVDPGTRRLRQTVDLSTVPRRIAPAPGGIWIGESYDGTIVTLDASTHQVGKPIRLFPPTRISFAAGVSFWAASSETNAAARLDPRTGKVLERHRSLDAPIAAADGRGAVWFASATHAEVQRLRAGRVTTIPIGAPPIDIATGGDSVWAVTPSNGKLWRVNPHDQAVVQIIDVGPDPDSVAFAKGSVWVGSRQAKTLTRVDARTNLVVSTLQLGRPVTALTFYKDQLWVSVS